MNAVSTILISKDLTVGHSGYNDYLRVKLPPTRLSHSIVRGASGGSWSRPDTQGRVRQGPDDKALQVWKTATRLHFNLDFRLPSQSLAACMTPTESIGGRAWPNFVLRDAGWEHAAML